MRSFLGFGQRAYIGIPQSQPMKLGGIAGVGVPLLFQWISYGASTSTPNVNVLVDLSNHATVRLNQVYSVIIDNTGSDNPIYVYAEDTGDVVPCQPNSKTWSPILTNGKRFWVVGEGFNTGDIPQTLVTFTNIPLNAFVNTELAASTALWKASQQITRGNTIFNQNFGVPALGDQTVQYTGNIVGAGVLNNNLFGTPYPSGFLYLTHADFSLNSIAAPGFGGGLNLILESTGISGTLYFFAYSCGGTAGATELNPIQRLLNFSAMNIKLDATQSWRWRCTALTNLTCVYDIAFNYTLNPN